MENINLTILICVHSTNDFYDELLDKSLLSLVNQTYKNFITLVILDECWFKTKERILTSRYDLNLKIIEKEKREGLALAKNFGLKHVDTEWVGFLDADDLYTKTKLEKQMDYIKNNKVDFLGTHTWNINSTNDENKFESIFDTNTYNTNEEIREKINYENILTHGSMVIRKMCLEVLGGYNNVKGMEDWDLWKRAIKHGFIFYQLPERLYIYRLNTSNKR